MGKFYDAMQRAANPLEEPPSADTQKVQMPDLDGAFLNPEEPAMDNVFREVVDPDIPESPSAIERAERSKTGMPLIEPGERPMKLVGGVSAKDVPDTELTPPDVSSSGQHPFSTAHLVDTGVFRSPVHAAYERITQRLLKYRRTPRQSVVLVTSAVTGEGSSSIARNTAVALGRQGNEQVLLIDGNLRSPSQHTAFGVERGIGLSDVLMSTANVTSAINGEDSSEISLMTAGSRIPSPAQLLSTDSLQGLMMAVLSLYDWVIVDSPPVTSFPDASSIAAACGGAILVVQAESTRAELVEEAKRILDSTGIDLLGAVLNQRRHHIPDFIYRRL